MKIVACEGKTVKPTGAASDAGRDGRGGPEGSNSPEHCSSGGGLGRSGVGDPDDAEKSYQSADELTD
ncbi:unnamed protein product [Protopolystoma xenopodis]|uniref:Uncharacterized protein n=1 Tax=Protopolystoma xenopodis TaxID=117903 RepID=A0A3S5CL35_9PLAT|nr:unnamed protein product [Protopolystoma xenopodis]